VYACPRYLHNHIPYYVKVDYAKLAAEQEARETPDYDLPEGASMESHHEFMPWSDTDVSSYPYWREERNSCSTEYYEQNHT